MFGPFEENLIEDQFLDRRKWKGFLKATWITKDERLKALKTQNYISNWTVNTINRDTEELAKQILNEEGKKNSFQKPRKISFSLYSKIDFAVLDGST